MKCGWWSHSSPERSGSRWPTGRRTVRCRPLNPHTRTTSVVGVCFSWTCCPRRGGTIPWEALPRAEPPCGHSSRGRAVAPEPGLCWYRCTVLVDGPVAGQLDAVQRAVLAADTIGSAKLAVRWMRVQALRIAAGLDPDRVPGQSTDEIAASDRLLTPVTDPVGDVPAELRAWARDRNVQQHVRDDLAITGRTHVRAQDSSGCYWLIAQRTAPPSQPPSATVQAPHRTGRRRHAGPR